jgi:hypothetical protein
MVQGYYTLEEAARILGMTGEELSQMAQHREVRAFADRGTWRFRTQDIEELARRRGQGSNPDLPLGEAPRPQPHDTPTARTSPEPKDEGVFNFGLGPETEQIDLGQELGAERSSPASPSGSKSGSKSSSKNVGSKSPTTKPGSDSDVRLVPDGSNVVFEVSSDSDIKLVDDSDTSVKSARRKATGPKEDSGAKLVPMDPGPQSPVRLTPDEAEDSSVLGATPIKTSSDSDVRLEVPGERSAGKSGRGEKGLEDSFLTEEIDLDAEMRKAEESARPKKTQPKPTPSAPFELSEDDLDLPKRPEHAADKPLTESSSDFDIALPATGEKSSVESESDVQRRKDEEVSLGEPPSGGISSESGINLGRPTDSGISLEPEGEGSDEIEFELRQRSGATPRPATPRPATPKPVKPAAEQADSSSEFELTLEDSGRLAPLEEESPPAAAEGEKDIFETDFEVPALEDDSGSQAMALDESDTDLESSDFDLALGEEDMAVDEESGSQVVALDDEEEVDEGAATVARSGRRGAAALAEEEAEEFAGGEELEEEVAPGRRAAPVAAAPTNWGVFTPVVMLVSFFVLFLLGLMSFELVRGMWGYHQSTKVASPVVRMVAGLFTDQKDLPTD